MPTYEVQRVRTFRMTETLVIKATTAESAALVARVKPTPLDVRKLVEDKNSSYLLNITDVGST